MDKKESESLEKLGIEFYVLSEIDEQWSYVQNKGNQRWLWLALDKRTAKVITFVFGRRNDSTFLRLKRNLEKFDVRGYYTDDWGSYFRNIKQTYHHVGKKYTWRVERMNLTLRNAIKRLNRKTIGFSKSQILHDKVIGSYINEYLF